MPDQNMGNQRFILPSRNRTDLDFLMIANGATLNNVKPDRSDWQSY